MTDYYEITTLNKKFNFYILDNCLISNVIKEHKVWESYMHPIFEKYVNKSSIVIECGCHIGTHSIPLASLCKTFYGFEPLPDTYDVLIKNVELNNINNAFIYKKGVADKEGSTEYLWISGNNPGSSGLNNNPMGKPVWINPTDKNIVVDLTTIDLLQLDKLDFMKIDVEGYETLVIEGAINTIKKCRPVIIIEVWKDHLGSIDINYTKSIYKNILDLGYDILNIQGPDFLFLPNEIHTN